MLIYLPRFTWKQQTKVVVITDHLLRKPVQGRIVICTAGQKPLAFAAVRTIVLLWSVFIFLTYLITHNTAVLHYL